jgi:hypothetical protein
MLAESRLWAANCPILRPSQQNQADNQGLLMMLTRDRMISPELCRVIDTVFNPGLVLLLRTSVH